MPKVKPFRGSSPPPLPPIVIKDVPYAVAAKPEVKSKPASAPVKDDPKPHYY